MGSPISPLMAEIFMDLFEEQLFTPDQPSPHPLLQKILYWHRYVDDVLCAWTGSINQLHEFLELLNNRYPSIRFTMEIGGNRINFLDLTISINEQEGGTSSEYSENPLTRTW
jgi:Fic family protein